MTISLSKSSLHLQVLKMSWWLLCYAEREQYWEERESGYIKELSKANKKVEECMANKSAVEELFHQEQLRWQMKEASYIERLNDLQNTLHKKEVVTQQYKIYEENFQQDRHQLQETQSQAEGLKLKIDEQQREIERLKMQNEEHLRLLRLEDEVDVADNFSDEIAQVHSQKLNGHAVLIPRDVPSPLPIQEKAIMIC